MYPAWDKFLENIRTAQLELGGKKDLIWFRGVTNSDYRLLPSLYRYKNGKEKEKELFIKYKQVANRLFDKRDSDWETLFDMQHYYIPTRLLDWTGVLGVAVFFALLKENNESAVYLLNPINLNKKSIDRACIRVVTEEKDFEYRSIYWEKKPFPPHGPIAMEVPFQNDRIMAQKGRFTIHGDKEETIEEQFPDCIKKVILKNEARDGAREFLEFANINEFSIFPDMVGLAPFIKNLAKLEKKNSKQ